MDSRASHRPLWQTSLLFGLEWLMLLGILAAYGAWPVPDVNETQYLIKAKHYWQPDWLSHDFFLNTTDAHFFFYAATGWLTLFFSLETYAWIGRLLTWGLLAAGWQTLSWAIFPVRLQAWLSLSLFLLLLTHAHQAGEWVVGGLEAKGFAYGLVFFALAAIVRMRWNLALVLLGFASLWHILVGGWSVIACAVIWFLSRNRPAWYTLRFGVCVLIVLGGVSAWPNLVLTPDVSSAVTSEAHRLIVYERLPHHLSYLQIDFTLRWRWAAMWTVWVLLAATWQYRVPKHNPAWHAVLQIHWFVLGGVLLVTVGIFLSIAFPLKSEFAAGWLRFYWFRLGDVVLPLGIAIDLTVWAICWRPKPLAIIGLSCLMFLGLSGVTKELIHKQADYYPRAFKFGDAEKYESWREMTDWIRRNTSEKATFVVPRSAQDFVWYAERSPVVVWKDIPQNPAGIVQWWERIRNVHGKPSQTGFYSRLSKRSPEQLVKLGKQYDARYLLTRSTPKLAFPIVHENGSFVLYRLPFDSD